MIFSLKHQFLTLGLASIAFQFEVLAQNPQSNQIAPSDKVKNAKVVQRAEHAKGEVSVIFEMIEDPGIPDPPPPPPRPTRAQIEQLRQNPLYQQRIAEVKETELIFLSATIVDQKHTLLRWWHEGKEYQAWSSVNFHYLRGSSHFEVGDEQFILFMGIGDVSTQDQRQADQYNYPPVRKNGRFRMIKGSKKDTEAVAPIRALHKFFRQNEQNLIADFEEYQEREALRLEELRKNPPVPQDTVIKFWPRKGSRYLEQKKEVQK